MQRYFIRDDKNWTANEVRVTGDDVHHILRVMRGEVGDKFICVNSNKEAALCEIRETSTDYVEVTILEWIDKEVELPIEVTIAQGLPKGDKFEYILQKGTELGATSFIPFEAERSIVIWDGKKMKKKKQRFEKIVKEAAEQSHRLTIPSVEDAMSIAQLIEVSKQYDAAILAYEEEAKTGDFHSFSNVLGTLTNGNRLLVCIGPEGGFSAKEVAKLREHGFESVRFGPRILRTETAALYALASISYHFEEMGGV